MGVRAADWCCRQEVQARTGRVPAEPVQWLRQAHKGVCRFLAVAASIFASRGLCCNTVVHCVRQRMCDVENVRCRNRGMAPVFGWEFHWLLALLLSTLNDLTPLSLQESRDSHPKLAHPRRACCAPCREAHQPSQMRSRLYPSLPRPARRPITLHRGPPSSPGLCSPSEAGGARPLSAPRWRRL